MKLLSCRVDVEAKRNRYLELNGTPVQGKPGIYRMTSDVEKTLAQIEQDGYQECTRMYGEHR
jgi:hypothetical protein